MFLVVKCWEFRLLVWHHLFLIQYSLFQVHFAQTLSGAGEVKPPLEIGSCAILKHLFIKRPYISTMKNVEPCT